MVLFALVSTPLLLYLYFATGVLSLPAEPALFRRPMVKGAASAPLLAGILLLISIGVEKRFSMEALFRYYLLRDTLAVPYLIMIGSLVAARSLMDRGDWELFTAMVVYAGTVYTVLGVLDVATGNHYFGPYELFFKPTLRMVHTTLLTAALITVIRQHGVVRWLALATIVALPPVTAMIGALSAAMWPIPAVIVTVALVLFVAGAVRIGPSLGYVRRAGD